MADNITIIINIYMLLFYFGELTIQIRDKNLDALYFHSFIYDTLFEMKREKNNFFFTTTTLA